MDYSAFFNELVFAGVMAAAINVAGQGFFRLKAWETISATSIGTKFLGKAAVTFVLGLVAALTLGVDIIAPIRTTVQEQSVIGKVITGLVIGGGSNSFQLLVEQIAKVFESVAKLRKLAGSPPDK